MIGSVRENLRREVLEFGLVDCVGLSYIHRMVEEQMPGADPAELQRTTIDTIRSLVEDGLVETGYPDENGDFVSQTWPESARELHDAYVAQYDDPISWFQRIFVNLTEEGISVATSTPEGRRIAEHERLRMESLRVARERGID